MASDVGSGPIVVFGATGKQGGAVARHLLVHGFEVHAVTRNPGRPEADQLRELGAKVVPADMDDPESLKGIMQGATGVFSLQNFWEVGAEREVAEGRRVADLVQAYGISFLVYSSVGGAERDTGIPHFDSKYQIEEHIRSLPISWCVCRPVWFMENLLASGMREGIEGGTLAFPLPPDVPLQMIAVRDIGVFAGMAFLDPLGWSSRSLEIAGDEMTMPEAAEVLSDHLGRKIKYQEVSLADARQQMGEEVAVMFEWFVDYGYQAPIEELRLLHPGLMRLEQWANVTWPVAARV